MSLTERQIEGINSFWNMTISHWDKAGRSEFNKDFPHLLVLIACTLGDMEKIMWLQEEYGREEIVRLANTDITPWCKYVSRQFGIEGPDDERPNSPDTVVSINDIRL